MLYQHNVYCVNNKYTKIIKTIVLFLAENHKSVYYIQALNSYISSYVECEDYSKCIIIATDNCIEVYELIAFILR